MTREELIRDIEKYAASARRTFDAGKDPGAALSRVRAMIEKYKDLSKHDRRGWCAATHCSSLFLGTALA